MSFSASGATDWQQGLLQSIEVGIVVLDRQFRVEVWNQFMENHSDILAGQIRGECLFDWFAEIDASWLKAKAEPVFNLNVPAFLIWEQHPYLFRFGNNRPITSSSSTMFQNVTLFPLPDASGEVTSLCMLVYDVTDQALGKQRIEKLNDELRVISRIDGLTGLYNRRYWQERFEQAFKLAQRREQPEALIMLDIDHFKKINDTYGHQAGDTVIRALAKVIQIHTRETDLAGRYGGEEFAIVLTDTDGNNGKGVAERIRAEAEATRVEHEGQILRFTVSLGIAEFCPHNDTSAQWLERADQALYQAKVSGRNRLVADRC